MLGVRLDELVKRDRQRKRQQITAAITAVIAVLAISLYAYSTAIQRQYQQQQAEQLAGFVLDLGARLENRIDVNSQIAINTEGLNYLQQMDQQDLSIEAQARIAEAHRQLGVVRQAQQLSAIEDFKYSLQVYSELTATDPESFLFEKGQAAFYVGADYFYRGELEQAAQYFSTYVDISQQLMHGAPANSLYQAELLNALSTLLALELERNAISPKANELTGRIKRLIDDIEPKSQTIETLLALANANEWLGESYELNGNQESYFGATYQSVLFFERALDMDPSNLEVTEKVLNSEFKLGLIIEDIDVKRQYLAKAHKRVVSLRAIANANEYWREYEEKLAAELAML